MTVALHLTLYLTLHTGRIEKTSSGRSLLRDEELNELIPCCWLGVCVYINSTGRAWRSLLSFQIHVSSLLYVVPVKNINTLFLRLSTFTCLLFDYALLRSIPTITFVSRQFSIFIHINNYNNSIIFVCLLLHL